MPAECPIVHPSVCRLFQFSVRYCDKTMLFWTLWHSVGLGSPRADYFKIVLAIYCSISPRSKESPVRCRRSLDFLYLSPYRLCNSSTAFEQCSSFV